MNDQKPRQVTRLEAVILVKKYFDSAQHDKAMSLIEKILTQAPAYAPVLHACYIQGERYCLEGDWEKARRCFLLSQTVFEKTDFNNNPTIRGILEVALNNVSTKLEQNPDQKGRQRLGMFSPERDVKLTRHIQNLNLSFKTEFFEEALTEVFQLKGNAEDDYIKYVLAVTHADMMASMNSLKLDKDEKDNSKQQHTRGKGM